MKVILINGPICAGKSEVTDSLHALNTIYHRLSIAGKLKANVDFITYHQGTKEQLRRLYQVYGAAMRAINGEDYWAKELYEDWASTNLENFIWVIDDARLPAEMDFFKSLLGPDCLIVRLDVSEVIQDARHYARYGRFLTPEERADITETALNDYPFDARFDSDVWSAAAIAEGISKQMPPCILVPLRYKELLAPFYP